MTMEKSSYKNITLQRSNETKEDNDECPLCLEPIEADDIDFYPCPCGYQICRFCWHRLANEEDSIEPGKSGRGLCPACRQEYPESPVGFNSNLTIEAMSELVKNKKKKRKQANKLKSSQQGKMYKNVPEVKKDEKSLAGLRVVQKNLVFVIGIPARLSQDDLRREFSKFGKIHKLVVGNNTNSLVNSVYVTYSKPEDAIKAIQALNQSNQCNGNNQIIMDGLKDVKNSKKGANLTLRASLGTTKYCTHWLKNMQCPKLPDCMYLHELADPEASFTKEEMQQGKHTEYEKKLINQYLSKKVTNGVNRSSCALSKDPTKQSQVGDFEKETSNIYSFSSGENVNSVDDMNPHSSDSDSFNTDHLHSNTEQHRHQQRNDDRITNNIGSSIKYNAIDEMIGISSDSSTSFSTCSSGSSFPHNHISSPEVEEEERIGDNGEEDEESGKENRCKSPSDEPMQSPNSPGHSIDDDGLDFDPISISTTGLEDLIRNNGYNEETNVTCTGMGHNISGNSLLASLTAASSTLSTLPSGYPSSNCYSTVRHTHASLRGEMRSTINQQELWRNSLKALLPNVNITFAAGSSTSNYFKAPPTTSHTSQHQQQYPFAHVPSQILPWFHQASQQQPQHSSHVNPFSTGNGLQNCQIPLGRAHQAYMGRPVVRQKQPPPGFANF